MQTLTVALAVAFAVAMLLVRHRRLHLGVTGDVADRGPQKFHIGTVPRVGGVAVALALAVALGWSAWRGLVGGEAAALLSAGLVALATGLAEDLTKRVSPRVRLLGTVVAAAIALGLTGVHLQRLDLPWVDAWMAWVPPGVALGWAPLGVAITLLGVAGLSHAINIIDGFHGLAAGVGVFMFAALGYVAWVVGDVLVLQMCLAMLGALLGFLLWNYPRGLIFLGDGGAYLVGFWLAQAGVWLVARNPQVSPWFVLLVCAYPVVETLFSIYRKRIVRGRSPAVPDGLHLHMLIHRRLLRWAAGPGAGRDLNARNAATAPYLWGMCAIGVVPAVLWWHNAAVLKASMVLFMIVYLWSYARLLTKRKRGKGG
ncbi:UDP-N-acetylmuramyl pentapeptide phosphotransferase/UDP-N-acetylglucosamine-1-phosphate transferase [Tepidimonas ignava]|uniref:UDP-N-acetylmuramyl pentapeptide phosphotransferase/UDP-N-acetylglucosamine-1-phosphate transferase n=1 Tax=Tepidimonas ignava TaxID=114249 RepID=A0A4R3LDR3_9BURK|nr:glycosyltransferase [Tepidimonas ignava]TCS97518.1 UDP-N-acetylmuramyl pentapeptide phosphotransferase/UDP-N-acetylglucosamine-1-phosphate transferase [Tepidimonas ignava]TSE22089.1 putative undecaprenyl-phosphate N-acetylglucosaminyl 1-phosphate transferase [Tepidimonas ignava]